MISIKKLRVGPYDNAVYVVASPTTGRGVVIDAAAEPDRILTACEGISIETVLTTHGHLDHIDALDPVKDALGIPWMMNLADCEIAGRTPDAPLRDGDEIVFGDVMLHVVHTPGHTPGSVSFVFEPANPGDVWVLFSGDTLFPGGPGATRWDYSDFGQIMDSLEKKLFARLPDSSVVHPGHGEDTSIGDERPHLEFWRKRGF